MNTDGRTVQVATLETEQDVTVAGISWAEPEEDVEVFLRTSTGGDTTAWESLDLAPESPESSTNGTDPIVLTSATTVQVATVSTTSITPSLTMVDPRMATADAMATTSSTGAPVIYSRKDWGANESLRGSAPTYARVQGVVIHHTAGSNSYTREQVPGIIRGIYSYHTQTLGWSDIGYNVLVDKYGRAWEGRYGGLTRAVQGAHAYGANHLTFGISLMGNYDTVQPPAVAMDTIARVSGWKMSLHKVNTHATLTTSTGQSFPSISGHRDSSATACPGRYIYNQMGSLRTQLRTYQSSYSATPVTVTAATAGTKETGLLSNVWGTVSAGSGVPVEVQALVDGRWTTSQKGTTGANGFYALALTHGADMPGVYSYRVVATLPNGTAISPTVTLARTNNMEIVAATAGTKKAGLATNIWGTVSGGSGLRV
ncbi:MAG: peptidoglycan recognition protein, partial [Propionibacterium sp.]|nr:peptidoglycan recognition protein [Propionibacterium sp.]